MGIAPPHRTPTLADDELVAFRASARELGRGAILGRYVILERVGAGGMGLVFAAYDPELDRRVAIKVLHPGDRALGSEGRARLLREAQALARLSHPNVVSVHDVGTTEHGVYLAMEFVQGRTVGDWLASEPTRAEILDVFARAGQGLAAAHAKGLVHRDFKPDNVMVGDDGRVRVMDFGLARSDRTVSREEPAEVTDPDMISGNEVLGLPLTRDGAMVGTPAYMAPEQWLDREVDARTDQFSFCVALYEALYGQRPFTGQTRQTLVLAVTKGEIADPPPGATVPAWLRRVLLRGLATEPDARFATLDALLEALRADPTRKRRRYAGLAAAGLGVAAWIGMRELSAGDRDAACETEAAIIDADWNDEAREGVRASLTAGGLGAGEETFERVAGRLDSYAAQWKDSRRRACRWSQSTGVDDASLAERARTCLDARADALRSLTTRLQAGGDGLVDRAVPAVNAMPTLVSCTDETYLRRRTPPPADAQVRIDPVQRRLADATVARDLGQYEDAAPILDAALSEATEIGWDPLLARAQLELGQLHRDRGDAKAAEPALVAAYLAAWRSDEDLVAGKAATMLTFVVGNALGRQEEGRLWARIAETAEARRNAGDDDLDRAQRIANLATLDFRAGKYEDAQAGFEAARAAYALALGPDSLAVADALRNLAAVHGMQGHGDLAEPLLQRTLAIQSAQLGSSHPQIARTMLTLGQALGMQGKLPQARALLTEALELRREIYGDDSVFVAEVREALCSTDNEQHDYVSAKAQCQRAVDGYEATRGPDHPDVASALTNLAIALRHLDEREPAAAALRRSLAIFESSLGADHPRTKYVRGTLESLTTEPLPHAHDEVP